MRRRHCSLLIAVLLLAAVSWAGLCTRGIALANGDCNVAAYTCEPPVMVTDSVSGQNVTLRWQMSALGSTPYAQAVERGPNAFTFSVVKLFTSGTVQTSYTDTNVAPGTYYYEVCNIYPNLIDNSEYDDCALALPEGVTVKAAGSANAGSGAPAPPNNPAPPAALPSQSSCSLSPIVDPNEVDIYVNAAFGGQCAADPVSIYATAESAGIPDDALSSFQIGANVQLEICEDANFHGACSTYVDNDTNMAAARDFQPQPISGPGMDNDHMSSMCVQWRGTPPGTPCSPATAPATAPTVTGRTQTSLTIAWTPGAGGTYQQVSCAVATPSGNACSALVPHDATSYTFTGLQPDQRYPLQVCTIEEYGDQPQGSLCADTVSARTLPPAPSNLTVKSVSGTGIELTWSTNISDPASQVTYTISRDGTAVMTGLVPVRIGGVTSACPYLPYNPATGQGNPACAPYFHPQSYPSSVDFTDSFTVNAPHYDYTVCAVDTQDDVVQACASVTADVHLIQPNVSPSRIPLPGA